MRSYEDQSRHLNSHVVKMLASLNNIIGHHSCLDRYPTEESMALPRLSLPGGMDARGPADIIIHRKITLMYQSVSKRRGRK
ncbi:hypothetical protein E2C01_069041 [Portunus trituberculatus]|uniref:Uncharacterized protein n=1 Tax=Portunus trituberculatus TaxID=210409 RepID=A0A5B7HYC1_PORTR|nr:hypothetical protein [Portunus trituberculatus]